MDQIYIGQIPTGQVDNETAFNIDNKAFPYMFNFFTWRSRVKRKRGTLTLAQLAEQVLLVVTPAEPWEDALSLTAGAANLLTGVSISADAILQPGSIRITVNGNLYTEPTPRDGTLVGNPTGTGTVNYATGEITISGGGVFPITGTYSWNPIRPVMGLEDFINNPDDPTFPVLLAFDTVKSYQINQAVSPPRFYNVNYYKTTQSPFDWSGADYQQFWTTNYQGALWATNNKPGFNFVDATVTGGSGTAIITFTFTSGGNPYQDLVVGDLLFFNQWTGSTINLLTGRVTNNAGFAIGSYEVTFTGAQTVLGTGIAQLLTASIDGQDGIKWYDGDPTSATGIPTASGLGWVNFSPPLTASVVSINDKTEAAYYLSGARMILPFKDRLLFISPWIYSTATGNILLQDTILWSWNSTPYYAAPVPNDQTFDVSAYYVDQTGKGGYLPAGISQPIKTVMNNEDALIVGFDGDGRKTRFVATDGVPAFAFYNINSQMPSSATFSSITLDNGGIDIGTYGICQTDQQGTMRIDPLIPDDVFKIKTTDNGMDRVNAQRDFRNEWIYFTYPRNDSDVNFPTETFMYNYRNGAWSFLYENYTHQGRFRKTENYTWQTLPYSTWAEWNVPWNYTSALIPEVIGGTPQGFVLIKDTGTGEGKSGYVKSITNASGLTQIESVNHCLSADNPNTGQGDFVYFVEAIGITPFNNIVGKVIEVIDADNFVVDINFPTGTYLGAGYFQRLAQPLLQTKQFNFYWDQGKKTMLCPQKYLFDATFSGQVTIQVYLSQNPDTPYNQGTVVPTTAPPPENNALIYSDTLFTCPEDYINNAYNQSLGNIGNGVLTSFNFVYPQVFSFNGDIIPGSVNVTVGNVATFSDNGDGTFTTTGTGDALNSSINYASGIIILGFTAAPTNQKTTTNFQYLIPNLLSPTSIAQNQIWHRFGTTLQGDSFQIGVTLNEAQMKNYGNATDEIVLHAMHFQIQPGALLA